MSNKAPHQNDENEKFRWFVEKLRSRKIRKENRKITPTNWKENGMRIEKLKQKKIKIKNRKIKFLGFRPPPTMAEILSGVIERGIFKDTREFFFKKKRVFHSILSYNIFYFPVI